jgi:hypothetical protein
MAFHDGTLALAPIAPVEVQGYVYDAKLRIAEIAREIWQDDALAERLESDAAELRRRFDEAFWLEEQGFYALGLDHEKRPVDSLTSNLGHLLWSGIVPEQRRAAIADLLMGDALWSGWGVRTMAIGEGAYNPLVYHDGTVWSHDNSLVAWGLSQSGTRTTPLASSRRRSRQRRTSTIDCRRCSPASRATTPASPWCTRRPRLRRRGRRGLPSSCCRLCFASCRIAPSVRFARTHRARRTAWRASRSRASTRSAGAGRFASRAERCVSSRRRRRLASSSGEQVPPTGFEPTLQTGGFDSSR